MEVHHHPDIHHESKKWKEYFLEFLMIFLAVTLGFFAENIREHFSDRTKEKQYIAGFIENVKDDTATLRGVIEFEEHQEKGISQMMRLAHVDMNIDSNRKSFYNIAIHYFFSSAAFKSNDITLQQLKNTGDYRFIEKDHVSDSLTKYDADIHSVYLQGNYYESYYKDILNRLDEILDMTIFEDTTFVKNGTLTIKEFPKLRDDNGKIRTLFNKVFDFKIITNSYIENNLKPQLENAKNIITFLKKEYHIKGQNLAIIHFIFQIFTLAD
ncbi:MAG: hypothetical protein ACMG51_10105 [Ginsengibacter sp.]